MMTSSGSAGAAHARSSCSGGGGGSGPLPLVVQTGGHQPVDLHPDAVKRGIGVRHVLLDAETLVHERHAGAGVEVCDGERQLGDLLTERFVQGEEVRGRG